MPDDVVPFLEQATTFLRKWHLVSLVTWDLPLPQGPLEGVPSGAARTARGPTQAVDAYPTYYDISSKEDIRARISKGQKTAAQETGVTAKHPVTDVSGRAGQPSAYESAVRLWLLEHAGHTRYGNPHGLVVAMTPVFLKILRVKEDRLKQIRRQYAHTFDSP